MRDLLLLTGRRLVLVDRQGVTGSRTAFLSVPHRSSTRSTAETAGHVDLDGLLTPWTDGAADPLRVERGVDLLLAQALLAQHLPR